MGDELEDALEAALRWSRALGTELDDMLADALHDELEDALGDELQDELDKALEDTRHDELVINWRMLE